MRRFDPASESAPVAPPSAPNLALPAGFWRSFKKDHWNKKPAVFKNLLPGRFPTTAEVFDALVECSDRMRGSERVHIKLFLESALPGKPGLTYASELLNPHHHLPMQSDRDLETYSDRIAQTFGGARYGIMMNQTQSSSWVHWQQMRTFIDGFERQLGVPLAGIDSGLFVGNYTRTPFGVHKDFLHVFYFVVKGRKRMALWPLERFRNYPGVPKVKNLEDRNWDLSLLPPEEAEAALADAEFLDGDAGDILYWPSSMWHRAEPGGDPLNVSISLGLSYTGPIFLPMPRRHTAPSRMEHKQLPSGAKRWSLPADISRSVNEWKKPARLASELKAEKDGWIRYITNGGFENPPPLARGLTATPDDTVKRVENTLLVALREKNELVVSGNGQLTRIPGSAAKLRKLEKVVATLNAGKDVKVKALFARKRLSPVRGKAKSAAPDADVTALLNELLGWRVIEKAAE